MITPSANPSVSVKLTGDDLKAAKGAIQRIESAKQNYGLYSDYLDRNAARQRLTEESRKAKPNFAQMFADGAVLNREFSGPAGVESRRFFKHVVRATLSEIAPVVGAAAGKQADKIRGQCADLEAAERQAAESAGVSFESSPTLSRLRESAARTRHRADQLSTGTSCSEQELRGFVDGSNAIATAPGDQVPKAVCEGVAAG